MNFDLIWYFVIQVIIVVLELYLSVFVQSPNISFTLKSMNTIKLQ